MPRFKTFMLAAMVAFGLVSLAVTAAHAGDAKLPKAVGGKTQPVYAVEQPVARARVESVLTEPRRIVTGTNGGGGWLLHYGTKRDSCARADVTSGSRMICVSW